MDVRRLRYFTGVVEAGSLSGAAVQRGISQPSLSRQISLLEEELGVKLFERQSRGVVPTHEGETLFARIRQPLEEINNALRDVRTASGKSRASIVLWLPPTVEGMLAGPVTRRIAASTYDFAVRIAGGPAGTIANLIKRKEFDVGIVYGPRESWEHMDWWNLMPDAITQDLLEEKMVLVGSASSDLKPDQRISIEHLAALPLVFPSRTNLPAVFHLLLQEMAERLHRRMDSFQESDSQMQMKEMVSSGRNYTILPLSSVIVELSEGTLKYASIDSPNAKRQLILVSRKDCPYPSARAKIIEIVLDEISKLVASGAWPAQLLF